MNDYSDTWDIVSALKYEAGQNQATAKLPPPVRSGHIFAHVFENLPAGISPGPLIAGEFGPAFLAHENRKKLIDLIASSKKIIPHRYSLEEAEEKMSEYFHCFGSDGGSAHTTVDFESIIQKGISGILTEIASELKNADTSKRNYLLGMSDTLEGFLKWTGKYAKIAKDLLPKNGCDSEKERLCLMARTCSNVPERPPESFLEALQAIWFVHIGIAITEHSSASLSLGRMDQYLYGLFKDDMQRGIPEEDLKKQFMEFLKTLNSFGDPACNINVGGRDEHGKSLFNPLSEIIINAVKELKMPSPILSVRIDDNTPQSILDQTFSPELFRIGQPTFYGEESCRRTMARRGVPENEVHKCCSNSCMGIMIPGEEWQNMWGTVINLMLPLELAMGQGAAVLHELPLELKTKPSSDFKDFDSFLEMFCAYLKEITD